MNKEKLLSVLVGSFTLIVLIAALMLVAGPGLASAQEKPIELKMSVGLGPKAGKYIRGYKPWAEMVEEATQGRVKVKIYPNGSLATSPEAYDATIQGTADIAWVPLGHYSERLPLTWGAYVIPGSGIKDPIIASRIIWSLYNTFPEIQKEFDDVKVLFMHAMAPIVIATVKKPIRSLSDIKGLKLAADTAPVLLESAGASVVSKRPFTTAASRLEQGEIDGITIGWEFFKTFGVTKIANYFTVVPVFTGPHFVMFMNKNTWNELPPDIQQAIMSVSGDVGSKLFAEGDLQSSQIVMDELRAQGKEIIHLSPEENARWADLARPIQEKQIADLEAKGLPARAAFNEILRMVKEYQPNEFIASKVEDIVGVWESRFGGKVSYIHYKADGTFSHASTIENLERIPLFTGTFWFEGTVFNSKDQLSPRASYELRVHKKGETPIRLSYTVIDDPISQRAKDLSAGKTWVASSPQEVKDMAMSPEELDEQYLIYFPENYEEQEKTWPLLLFLHSAGQHEPPPQLLEQGKHFSFIIVVPLPTSMVTDFIDRVLNDVVARYRVNEDRIYVTGLSMGGTGTWKLALTYPQRFAAVSPIGGRGDPEKIELIKHLPVWVFHGAKDESVSIKESQDMVDALKKVGGNVKFTIYPDAGHDVWTETYNNPELYEWFLKHHR